MTAHLTDKLDGDPWNRERNTAPGDARHYQFFQFWFLVLSIDCKFEKKSLGLPCTFVAEAYVYGIIDIS